MPTYNEVENLPELLERLDAALDGKLELEPEVIIADDASPDGTASAALALAPSLRLPLRVVSSTGRRSLAGAVVDGARAARGRVVVVLDADLSHAPEDVPALARAVLDGSADVAIASRYVPGGGIEGWSLRRYILSATGTWLARRIGRCGVIPGDHPVD
jgi:dolichol-phosphate mannosyltransferase